MLPRRTNVAVEKLNATYASSIAKKGQAEVTFGVTQSRARAGATGLVVQPTVGMLVVSVTNAAGRGDKGDLRLANNTAGMLVEIGTGAHPALVRFSNGNLIRCAWDELTVGWAATYHRAQGQTLDCDVVLDLRKEGGVWDASQLYVGITRVRRLQQLTIVM